MSIIRTFNWGKGILIGMSSFMLFILCLVITMIRQPADDYDSRYYEKGLRYDEQYNAQKNVLADNMKPMIVTNSDGLSVSFSGKASGVISVLHSSDKSKDLHQKIANEQDVRIPLQKLSPGRRQVVCEWVQHNKKYLYKQEVALP